MLYMLSYSVIRPFLRKAVKLQESICCESRSLILSEDFPAPTMYFWIGFGLDPMSPKLIVYFSYKTLLKISHYCIISSNIKDTDFIVPVLIADDNRTEINQYGGLSGRVMSLSGYLRTIIFWKIFFKKSL